MLAPGRLAPAEIVGLVVVPGRAQSPVDFGERYALVGIDDLRDRLAEVSSPREFWAAIKAHELRDAPEVVPVTERYRTVDDRIGRRASHRFGTPGPGAQEPAKDLLDRARSR